MAKNSLYGRFTLLLSVLFLLVLATHVSAAIEEKNITTLRAIGQIESVYRNRVSMKILKIIGSHSDDLSVATGSWVSFDLPQKAKNKKRRRRNKNYRNIKFGTIVDTTLIGNTITEYETEGHEVSEKDSTSMKPVLLWSAQSVEKIKNVDDYAINGKKINKRKKRRKNRNKKKEDKAPAKIWTQEETVRGKIIVHKKKLFIKEPRVRGRKNRGLDVVDDEWYEKLKDFHGQDVVVYAKTHRANVSSGTIEVKSVMKIYPK